MDALVFNWIDANRETRREREREGERQGEKGESGRNPPLGVSIKRSIVSDRESSRGRFNGAWSPNDNWITFRVVEKHTTRLISDFVYRSGPMWTRDAFYSNIALHGAFLYHCSDMLDFRFDWISFCVITVNNCYL